MRMWEVEDNKAVPSNLVLEQDLVLRVRRLHRLGTRHLVVNFALSETTPEYGGRGPLEIAQGKLRFFAESHSGTYAQVSNGDVFVVWPRDAVSESYIDVVLKELFPEGFTPEEKVRFCLTFDLPEDYTELRERIGFYVEGSKSVSYATDVNSPSQLLQTDAARGVLTAWSVNQIEKLLREIDLQKYIRRQPVYELTSMTQWTPLFEECFISFEDLKKTFFPRLEVTAPYHLFLALCLAMDKALLSNFSNHYEWIEGKKTSFNLSIPSVMESAFAQFTKSVPTKDRGCILFEIHRADLLQDFEMTRNAIQILRKEGFRVVLDGITPDMLDFVNLALLTPDYIKINIAKDQINLLNDLSARAALAKLPHNRIIFYHCDSEAGFRTGRTLGITRYQGWLIDKLVNPSADNHDHATS